MEVEQIMRIGKVNSIIGWKSTNKTKTSNYKEFRERYQKTRFGQIKSGLAKRAISIRHGKFWDQRKLRNGLLKEITNLKPVKSYSTSISRYAATILGFVNNMEQIGCAVTNAKEAPFVMSQLLSKLDACEMHCVEREEYVLNLLDWLNSEASLQSRLRKDANYYGNSFEHRISAKI